MSINNQHTEPKSAQVDGATYTYELNASGDATILKCATENTALVIPNQLEGHPVTTLASNSFAKLETVSELVCAESIRYIAHHAFEQCRNLKRLVFPEELDIFKTEWITGCVSIESIVLPGMAPEIPRSLFGVASLRELTIGRGTHAIDIPQGHLLHLDKIRISNENTSLLADDCCLYANSGKQLVALVKDCERYQIADGCVEISPYAFAYRSDLKEVEFPKSLSVINDLAFLDCGIRTFVAPPNLVRIGKRAFMECVQLEYVQLNVGLLEIGEGAFARTKLAEHIRVPASVAHLGSSIAGFPEELSAESASVVLDEGNPTLFMDEQGLVYQRGEDGLVLHDASYFSGEHARLDSGTVRIADAAFKRHRFVRRVSIPNGTTHIGESAFAQCAKLEHADLPDSLERIEDEAFFGSSLARIHIPARCVEIGTRALDTTARRKKTTRGNVNNASISSMRSASVDANNERYYVSSGLLCRWIDDARSKAEAVLYVGPDLDVRIPPEVIRIADHAFSGTTGIDSLHIHKNVKSIGVAALLPTEPFGLIEVELNEPLLGHASVAVELPTGDFGVNILQSSLYRRIDPKLLMESYDGAIPRLPDLYDRYRRMLDRLSDPVLLADWAERVFRRDLTLEAQRVCLVLAEHNDTRALDQLVELGLASERTLSEAIDRLAGNVRTVTATARLLELRRMRFGQAAEDFGL